MDLLIILNIVVICLYVEAQNLHLNLPIPAAGNLNASTTVVPIISNSGNFPFPEKVNENEKGDKKEEKEKEEGKIENVQIQKQNPNYHSSSGPTMAKVTSEKLLLNLLSQLQRRERANGYEMYNYPTQPIRRENDNWENNYDFDLKETTAHLYDDSESNQRDYNDFYDYRTDYFVDMRSTTPDRKVQSNTLKKQRQDYYEDSSQKSEYHDYHQNKVIRRYKNENQHPQNLPQNHRHLKRLPTNSCKQYLQFLKYAFKKLDEAPQDPYEYVENFNEDNYKNGKNGDYRTTNVMGPTVFIDTCGTNGHSNFEKFTYDGDLPSTIPYFPSDTLYSGLPKYDTSTPSYFYKDTQRTDTAALTTFTYPSPWFEDAIKPTAGYEPEPTTVNYGKNLPNLQVHDDYFYNNFPFNQPDHKNFSKMGKYEKEPRYKNRKYSTMTDLNVQQEHTTFRLNTVDRLSRPDDIGYKTGHKATTKTPHTNLIFSNTLVPLKTTWPTATKYALPVENFGAKSSMHNRDCNDKMLPCPDILNVTYPLNGYCNKYVTCEMGLATRRTCPEGLQFNVVTKNCDLPHNSFCNYMCPEEDGYYGVPGDCAGYFICKGSIPEYRMCPPGLHWDVTKKSCSFVENSSCPMKCSSSHEAKQYDGVCNAYVICINGIPFFHKCPPNMNFDRRILTCVPQNMFRCENNPALLTMNSNINDLCRNVQVKYGSKTWCRFVNENGTK